ncbi:MAG: hypothetical protein AAFX87_18440 [Bacteroidota bacterium]
MLYLYIDDSASDTHDIIKTVEGLEDHISILADDDAAKQVPYLRISDGMIYWPANWVNTEPPLLFPPTPFNTQNLLAIILTKLGHYELALSYDFRNDLRWIVESYGNLIEGSWITTSPEENTYYTLHNKAILRHYNGMEDNGLSLADMYKKALDMAPDADARAFTARQYATYLSDGQQVEQAEQLLRDSLEASITDQSRYAIQLDLAGLLTNQISIPYDMQMVEELKGIIRDTLQYYENIEDDINVAMLLVHASEVANVTGSYSEALGYINRAIEIYSTEEITEFLANAYLRKGMLLYTWAQDGNPQFYKTAVETYQEALKIFTKEEAPEIFAEIHHYLGVIYAEMPTDPEKKAIWSAVSASSFKESLAYFDREEYPYQHALILNNYANALMKYPESKHSDNYEKAISYLVEALEIRTPEAYPLERTHTLLNYLEACWRANNVNQNMERVRHKDMMKKAREIMSLTDDDEVISQAEGHISRLKALGNTLMVL